MVNIRQTYKLEEPYQ